MGIANAWSGLEKLPATLLITLVVGLCSWFGTGGVESWGSSSRDLMGGSLFRLLTCFVFIGGVNRLGALLSLGVLSGLTEYFFGTRQFVLLLVIGHVATLTILALSSPLDSVRDSGPSAGYFCLAGYLLFQFFKFRSMMGGAGLMVAGELLLLCQIQGSGITAQERISHETHALALLLGYVFAWLFP